MPEAAETFVPIDGVDAWDEFWSANAVALEDEIGDELTCRCLAENHLLIIGGGASPRFRVGFVG